MGGYKEYKIFDILKRKSIIIRYIIFMIAILCIITALTLQLAKEKKNEQNVITYTEDSNLNYKVYLKNNDFFDKNYSEEDNQYIASLIDYIDGYFEYELKTSRPKINYKYTYKIVAEINVEDKTTHKSLYTFKEDLIEEKEYEFNSNSSLKIFEPVKIDYNKYNDTIKKFVDLYDLNNCTSTLEINMYVNILDDIRKDTKKANTPVVSLNIPLTTETLDIEIESNLANQNELNVCETINKGKYLYGIIILVILETYLIIKLFIFINDTKNEKAVYNMRLRKIMSNYGSYIQKTKNDFDFKNYQILEIKSFEDLLQVKETLNKPILMTEKTSAMETYFFIPSEDIVYIFELKAGNLRSKGKRYKEKEDIEEINIKKIEDIIYNN